VSTLRIRCALSETSNRCDWAVLDGERADRGGDTLDDVPLGASRIDLVVAAADVLITRVQLPPTARRRAGSTLAYAVEEHTLGDPEAQHVTWLGRDGDDDVLAVVDRGALERCIARLREKHSCPIRVYCETLLLPFVPGVWSMGWNGYEGLVRTGELDGAATDAGDAHTPPLALELMLQDAAARGAAPDTLAVYTTSPDAEPQVDAWRQRLGVAVSVAGVWDPLRARSDERARITLDAAGHGNAARLAARLRPAAWLVAAALAIHGIALTADWARLTLEQRALRAQMETRFRAAFPEAVAVVDPALQMRRKLADARHAASRADESDFLPLIGHVAAATSDLAHGTLRLVTYDRGRLTLQLALAEDADVQRIATRLRERGLRVDMAPASASASQRALVVAAGGA
jgi:general secretion pathway protein L